MKNQIVNFVLFGLSMLISTQPILAQPVMPVKDIVPGFVSSVPTALTNVNGTLFFTTFVTEELWKSDGTVNGTLLVKEFTIGGAGPVLGEIVNAGGTILFRVDDGTNGDELWVTDGTTIGTMLLADIWPGPNSSSPGWLTNLGGSLLFRANDGTAGSELWLSDGTSTGTVLVKDISPGPGSSTPSDLADLNGTLFFRADDGTNGEELWQSDAMTAGTVLVKDINPGSPSSSPVELTVINNVFFFSARDLTNGRELWKSDGTANGTVLVKDINPGDDSFPGSFTDVNGTLFFSADDGVNGEELWKSDGTEAGTVLVKDISPGPTSSFPLIFTNVNGTLFFKANDGVKGQELWKSDGTAAGTVLVKDIFDGPPGSIPGWLTDVQGTLFFSAFDGGINGNELWTSDGTTEGTVLVEDINPGASNSNPSSLVNRNGTLFFTATDNVIGIELWALQSPIDIILTPINPPIQIPAGGGPFQFTVTVSNISAVSQSTQIWNTITRPDGEVVGPTLGPFNPTLGSGEVVTPTVTQNVPAAAPAGQYTYTFNVGTFPNTIDDSDSFTFTKLSSPTAKISAVSELATNWEAKWDAGANQPRMDEVIPEAFVLEQNYPNPFNPSTTISYQLPKAEKVRITIYDLTGRQVRELLNENKNAGSYTVQWDGRSQTGQTVATGLYIYQIRAGQFNQNRKMLFMK